MLRAVAAASGSGVGRENDHRVSERMDLKSVFGGNPLGVTIRLALISLVVGIVLSALGIDLSNFFYRINALLRDLYNLGFSAIDWVLQYMLLGALVVVPIWLVARLAGAFRGRQE